METKSIAWKRCIQIIKTARANGYELQIPARELRKIVMVEIGADERTVQKYMEILKQLEFIKVVSPATFQIIEKSEPLY
jgi:hypothetical protein